MTDQTKDRPFTPDAPGTGTGQGGSNLGGQGATSATDLVRDPEAEGYTLPAVPVSSARDQAIIDQAEGSEGEPADDQS